MTENSKSLELGRRDGKKEGGREEERRKEGKKERREGGRKIQNVSTTKKW